MSTDQLLSPSRQTDYGMVIEPEVIDPQDWRLTPDARDSVATMLANTVDFYISTAFPISGVRVTLRLEAL